MTKDELPPLFAPGQRLGRYELLQRLAVGGMAEVYLAYAVGPGDFRKVVAIKRLLPQHALDPQLLRMFLDEARLMAHLSHPNVTQVTDVDDGGGSEVPYFVMEYVHGTDLRGVLNAATGPLPVEQALAITSAVAAGLHHAHEHRGAGGQPLEIIHRDVSPSNVLISFDGGVKVTDFGVAKWTEQKSFTHQGQLKGKFAHMSPEQCRGEVLDRRSDVFALGTLLYEMTTGQPPFVAESEYELLTQIVSRDAPPPRRVGAEYPAQLASIVMRSLGRSRDDRYPTTQHLQLELEAFAREQRLVVSPVALAEYLESLFSARVTEWREALASGQTLADHLERRVNPSGQAYRNANQRTATDVFAVGPSTPASRNPAPAPPSTARGTSGDAGRGTTGTAGEERSARTSAKLTRRLAITGAAALVFLIVLVATELTSRWQRASRTAVTPVLTADPVSSAPSIASTAPPVQSTSSQTASQRATSSPVPESTRPIGTAARRGRDTGAATRLSRRGADTAAAPSDGTDPGPPSIVADTLAGRPPAPAPGTPVPTAAERTEVPPPAPIKVWDPDSPVPP